MESETVETLIGWANVTAADGVSIALVGMAIVFSGLVLVSLFINYLPWLLEQFDVVILQKNKKIKETSASVSKELETQAPKSQVESDEEQNEIIAAVFGAVLALVQAENPLDSHQKITLDPSRRRSIWGETGRMRSLSRRK